MPKGRRRRGFALTLEECNRMRRLFNNGNGLLISTLAERFNVSRDYVAKIVHDPQFVPSVPRELEPLK